MTDMQVPAHLTGTRRTVARAAVEHMGLPPVPYIKLKAQAITLVDATGAEMPIQTYGAIFLNNPQSPVGIYLDAVCVDANEHMSKAYYPEAYDENAQSYMPPSCWSDNGIGPSIGAIAPQALVCQGCPNNKWGSKINNLGNEVKACDDIKKLAWFVPSIGLNLVFLMRLKGSSHKHWRSYVETISKQRMGDRQLDPTDLITRIYFEPGLNGILNFTWVGLIDPATAKIEDAIWQANATDSLVGRLDVPRQTALPAPGPGQQAQQTEAYLPPAAPPRAVMPPPPAPPPLSSQLQGGVAGAPTFGGAPMNPTSQPQPAAPAPAPRQRRNKGTAGGPMPGAAQNAQAPAPANPAPPPGGLQGDIPAFLRRAPAPAAAQTQAPQQPAPPPANFGMQQGVEPNSEVMNALNTAFRLPTQQR